MEYKLFEGDVPHVSTFEFHEHRERVPHVDQPVHQGRLDQAMTMALDAAALVRDTQVTRVVKIVDLGCGDGGQIQRLNRDPNIAAVGYDFQPSNVVGWAERGQLNNTFAMNFVEKWYAVIGADIYMITECLEHLKDPHAMVRNIHARGAYIVASSPWTEHVTSHDECHAWAWDPDGYAAMILEAGFSIIAHEKTGMFQVILGAP